jgi:hypothetical protein
MASGDTLVVFTPLHFVPATAVTNATLDTRNSIPVLDFTNGVDDYATFVGILPRHYGGNGVTVSVHWMASPTTTTGAVVWGGQFERANTDLDTDSFATAKSAASTTSGTNGILATGSIAFTHGPEMDTLAAGEPFRFRIFRDGDNVSDDMLGDAELFAIEIRET